MPWDETDNQITHRVHHGAKLKDFFTIPAKGHKGVSLLIGKDKSGKSQVQSVHFDKKRFSNKDAHKWVSSHPDLNSIETLESQKKYIKWNPIDESDPLEIGVQFEPGDDRFGNKMSAGYGYIRNHAGTDGEALDVYLGPDLTSKKIFRIDQLKDDGNQFDEHKFMIGYNDLEEAKQSYLAHIPEHRFGRIQYSNLSEIKSLKKKPTTEVYEKIKAEGKVVLEYTVDQGIKRAKIVKSYVAPPDGEKISNNDRQYIDPSVYSRTLAIQQRLAEGEKIVAYLGHPNGAIDSQTGKYAGFNQKTNPKVSNLIWVEIGPDGAIYCTDEFLSSPAGLIWSEKAYRREYLPRSWRATALCDGPDQTGDCFMTDFDGIDWLDPEIDAPGFTPARMIEVLEKYSNRKDLFNLIVELQPLRALSITEAEINDRIRAIVESEKVCLECKEQNTLCAKCKAAGGSSSGRKNAGGKFMAKKTTEDNGNGAGNGDSLIQPYMNFLMMAWNHKADFNTDVGPDLDAMGAEPAVIAAAKDWWFSQLSDVHQNMDMNPQPDIEPDADDWGGDPMMAGSEGSTVQNYLPPPKPKTEAILPGDPRMLNLNDPTSGGAGTTIRATPFVPFNKEGKNTDEGKKKEEATMEAKKRDAMLRKHAQQAIRANPYLRQIATEAVGIRFNNPAPKQQPSLEKLSPDQLKKILPDGVVVIEKEKADLLSTLATEREQAAKTTEVKNFVFESLSKDKFGDHDLKDQTKYPAAKLKEITNKVVEAVTTQKLNKDQAEREINLRLEFLTEQMKDYTLLEAARKLPQMKGTMQSEKPAEIKETFKLFYDAADKIASSTEAGKQRLEIRDGMKADIHKKWDAYIQKFDDKLGSVLLEAAKVISFNNANESISKRKMYSPELREAAVEAGFIPATEAVMTSATLANQAVAADVIYHRIFEEDESNRVLGMLGADELVGALTDPLNQFGDELRWATHYFEEPDSDNDGIIDDPVNDTITAVDVQRGYDSAFADEMAYEYQWTIKSLRNLENGLYKVRIYGELIDSLGAFFARRLAKQKWTEMDNIARRNGGFSTLDNSAFAVTGEDVTYNATASLSNFIVGNEIDIASGSGTVHLTYHTDVTHIVRLQMEQGVDGTTIVPWLIIRPYVDRWLDRNQVRTNTINPIVGKVYPSNQSAANVDLILGYLDPKTKRPLPNKAGATFHGAIDYENCLLLLTADAHCDATHTPQDLGYSYCPPIINGGNLVIKDLTVPDTKTGPEHYNDILQSLIAIAAHTNQVEEVWPKLAVGSSFIMHGILTAAQRWQQLYQTIGSNLVVNFAEVNYIGKVGPIQLFGTNGKLPGGDSVITITAEGYSKWAVTEPLTTDGMESLKNTTTQGNPVGSTTSMRQIWRLQRAIKTPQVYNKDTGVPYNKLASPVKLIGTVDFI